ncbi:transglutaminase-like cysteine peptidase [Rhizobium sp. L1K21]|uniref:transglutaminase-like cysteine peptidase n=1 Tax=Rhizobium sp. L1K21 TaxID=2954933 RepID=UPI0020936E02|nr:transglutaminase-like cysteine peptidase [Rhizobium sp. L1K21]MCO6187419.1 transglutaminase-like cysteine peptidase [Rhizobium sp. L1K21]
MAFRYRIAATVSALLLGVAPSAVANATTPLAMQTGSTTSQPIGHYEFCQVHKADCAEKAQDTAPPRLTSYGWQLIREVNLAVNRRIVPMTDQQLYGRDEVWEYPVDAGDCEDFVLEKRRELIAKGIPENDLLITVVRKPDGEGHAVLTVRTADGDYILDNLDNQVKIWTDTPYHYLKRQSVTNAGRWVTIENGQDVVVGALRK